MSINIILSALANQVKLILCMMDVTMRLISMRIAYFTDTFLPRIDGITYTVSEHSKLLSARGNKIRIYAPSYPERNKNEKLNGVMIERYPSIPLPTYKGTRISFPNIYTIYKSIKKFNPDIIHFHTPGPIGISAILLARFLKKPLVTTYHTLWSEVLPPLPPFNIIYKFFKTDETEKDLFKNAIWKISGEFFDDCDVIISPAKTIMRQLLIHNHKGKIVVVSNGIDTNKFKAKVRAKTNLKILYVGRLSHEKNVDMVIKAFAKVVRTIPNAKMEIVGDGPVLKSLKNLVDKLKLSNQIVFHGSIDREKLVNYYKRCDVFATGSAMEVQPLTLLEAMSCGLPVVGVKRAGVAEMVINNVNGYLVSPSNSNAMSTKIVKILSDNKLRLKLGKNSRKTAKENSLLSSIQKLENLYKQTTRTHWG